MMILDSGSNFLGPPCISQLYLYFTFISNLASSLLNLLAYTFSFDSSCTEASSPILRVSVSSGAISTVSCVNLQFYNSNRNDVSLLHQRHLSLRQWVAVQHVTAHACQYYYTAWFRSLCPK